MKFIYKYLLLLLSPMFCFAQVKLGDKISQYKIIDTENLLINSSDVVKSYKVHSEFIDYNVCLNKDSLIFFILTKDVHFSTDGFKVGCTYKAIKIKNKKKMIKWNGWGNFIELNSGWCAVFDYSKIKLTSKVLFFFKYDSKLKTSNDNYRLKIQL